MQVYIVMSTYQNDLDGSTVELIEAICISKEKADSFLIELKAKYDEANITYMKNHGHSMNLEFIVVGPHEVLE